MARHRPIACLKAHEGPREHYIVCLLATSARTNVGMRHVAQFGTDFKQADQLFFDQVAETAAENETLKTAAQANTLDNFKHVFDRMLEGFFVDRMEGNEEIFDKIMNDSAFRNLASEQLMREVYKRLRNRQRQAARA